MLFLGMVPSSYATMLPRALRGCFRGRHKLSTWAKLTQDSNSSCCSGNEPALPLLNSGMNKDWTRDSSGNRTYRDWRHCLPQSQLFLLASGVWEWSATLQEEEKALRTECLAEFLDWDFHYFPQWLNLWKYHWVNVGAKWSNQILLWNQPLTFEFIEISVQKCDPDRSRVSLENDLLHLNPVSFSPHAKSSIQSTVAWLTARP